MSGLRAQQSEAETRSASAHAAKRSSVKTRHHQGANAIVACPSPLQLLDQFIHSESGNVFRKSITNLPLNLVMTLTRSWWTGIWAKTLSNSRGAIRGPQMASTPLSVCMDTPCTRWNACHSCRLICIMSPEFRRW